MFYASTAHAQLSSVGIANYLQINASKIEDGDIISASDKGYVLSKTPYDSKMVGVVSLNPSVTFKSEGVKGYPVINTGTALIKVTDQDGDIKKGDFVTSSTTPGTGMKAGDSGYILGIALKDVKFSRKGDIKQVEVNLNPHFVQFNSTFSSSILDIFKIGKIAASEKPSKVLQYIIAAIIMIASLGCGFIIFAKSVNTGLEALGRNPLAGRMIQLGIAFNVALIALIIIVGTGLAYLVIRL